MSRASQQINIAISKGRIMSTLLPLLAQVGVVPSEGEIASRGLIVSTVDPNVKLTILRSADVPTYVDYGAADLGVSGKDVLLENPEADIYEMLDLGIGRCRLVLAGCKGTTLERQCVRVATKYVNSTRHYFADAGKQVEIIRLHGAMELAPISGLADFIVDLVDTGKTLAANGLCEIKDIMPISARVIANKAAMKTKHKALQEMLDKMYQIARNQKESNG